MDIRIQLANHLLTRANVHPIALSALCYLLNNQYEGVIYNDNEYDNYCDQLSTLIENTPFSPNFDTRAELMQGLINNDKLNPTALKIFASMINILQNTPGDKLGLNETIWQNYLHKIGVDELYEYAGDE